MGNVNDLCVGPIQYTLKGSIQALDQTLTVGEVLVGGWEFKKKMKIDGGGGVQGWRWVFVN